MVKIICSMCRSLHVSMLSGMFSINILVLTSASNYAVVRTRMSPIPEQSVTYRNVTKFKTGNDELDWGELQIIPVG